MVCDTVFLFAFGCCNMDKIGALEDFLIHYMHISISKATTVQVIAILETTFL